MLELRFATKKEAEKAADALSEFDRPNLGRRVETSFDPSQILEADYDRAMEKLKEVGQELDSVKGENPAELLQRTLRVSRSLFKSGGFAKITEAKTRGEAEDLLYETADELKDVEDVKDRADRSMRKFAREFKQLRERGGEPVTSPEVPEDVSDDLARYSLLTDFLVSPILDIVERYGRAEDPLGAFIRHVHLDVTPISDRFEGLKRAVDLEADVTYTVELGMEHVLHMEDVLQRLKGAKFLDSAEGILYSFLTLRLIADEVLTAVRGRKKAPYGEFVREVGERINTSVHEFGGGEEVHPYATDEVVGRIVQKLKRAGLVRKKGNKISEV